MNVNYAIGAAAIAVSLGFCGCRTELAGICADDLTELEDVELLEGAPVEIVRGKEAMVPIVTTPGWGNSRAARYLQKVILEATGAKLKIIEERPDNPRSAWTNSPAIFIGDTKAVKMAGLAVDPATKPQFGTEAERFSVIVKNGSVYFVGNRPHHAVYDFCERVLGVRQYWEEKHGGRSVPKRDGLSVPSVRWSDAPVYDNRDLWPYDDREWAMLWKCGGAHGATHHVHEPGSWVSDTNYNYMATRPEIFAMQDDGKRGANAMLCYGCPKTLETYIERIDEEIATGKRGKAGGIVDLRTKTITVSQDDLSVYCNCEYCKAIKAKSDVHKDCYSDVLWGHFTKKLAGIAKKRYPGWTISILPYKNTCTIPPSLDLSEEGNVECFLCTMPGLAMLKDEETREREEGLIREWAKRTGRKVHNWHYIIWPCIYTAAPYVFGETIQGHYRRMRDCVAGSFLNGRYDEARLCISAYVWLRALWNPEFDLNAIYDTFANRMFGPAAKPMRKLIQMQEDGWNRQWPITRLSNKNVYNVSYPREDVLKMQELFAEAKQLAAGDELTLKRIAYYEGGFKQFFKESAEYASGVAFPPLMMEKTSQNPKIDGKLDEDCWKTCDDRQFVRALLDKQTKKVVKASVQTHVKAVWTPQGMTFGIKCDEPDMANLCDDAPIGNYWANDAIDALIDVGGESGMMMQLLMNASGKLEVHADGMGNWKGKNFKYAVYKGQDFWSLELYLPYNDLKEAFPHVEHPTTSGGMYWTGNFSRLRVAARGTPLGRRGFAYKEWTRMNTRGSEENRNTDVFSKLVFKE